MLLKGRQVLLHYKTEMNSDALEGLAGSAPLLILVVLMI
jgi:hypothetical protein